jgi:hypothetical protein
MLFGAGSLTTQRVIESFDRSKLLRTADRHLYCGADVASSSPKTPHTAACL